MKISTLTAALFCCLLMSCSKSDKASVEPEGHLLLQSLGRQANEFDLEALVFEAALSDEFVAIQSETYFKEGRGPKDYTKIIHSHELSTDRNRCNQAGQNFVQSSGDVLVLPTVFRIFATVKLIQGTCVIATRDDLREADFILTTRLYEAIDTDTRPDRETARNVTLRKLDAEPSVVTYKGARDLQQNIWTELGKTTPVSDLIQSEGFTKFKVADTDLVASIEAGGLSARAAYDFLESKFVYEGSKKEGNYSISIVKPLSQTVVDAIINKDFEPYRSQRQRISALHALVAGATSKRSDEILPYLMQSLEMKYTSGLTQESQDKIARGEQILIDPSSLQPGYKNPEMLQRAALIASQLNQGSAQAFYEAYQKPIEKYLEVDLSRESRTTSSKADGTSYEAYTGLHLLKKKVGPAN